MHNLIIKKIWNVIQFKCGAVRLSDRRFWNTRVQINNTPHPYSMNLSTMHTNTSDECHCHPCTHEFSRFSIKD